MCRLRFSSADIAYQIWLRIKGFVPETVGKRRALGCSPRIRVYRYVKGQRRVASLDVWQSS